MKDNYLTKTQFCSALGIIRSQLYRLTKLNGGPQVARIATSTRDLIPSAELTAWKERHTTVPSGPRQTEAEAA